MIKCDVCPRMIKPMTTNHTLTSGTSWLLRISYTVNVDIFACIKFRGFTEIGNFAWIKIRVLRINGSLSYHKSYVHSVHIFADI